MEKLFESECDDQEVKQIVIFLPSREYLIKTGLKSGKNEENGEQAFEIY